jgi:hypothetical protein
VTTAFLRVLMFLSAVGLAAICLSLLWLCVWLCNIYSLTLTKKGKK